MFTWDSKMSSEYENCKTIFYGIGTIFKQTNMDYPRKFADEGIQTIGTSHTSPLTLSGHVTVQILPRHFLVTALICAIHHFELTCHFVALFCNQSKQSSSCDCFVKTAMQLRQKKYYCCCRTMILNATAISTTYCTKYKDLNFPAKLPQIIICLFVCLFVWGQGMTHSFICNGKAILFLRVTLLYRAA